jgi:hypothetical protein
MAPQSGFRLAEERKRHGFTHAQLAKAMGVTPGRVSQIERGEVATIDAIPSGVRISYPPPPLTRQYTSPGHAFGLGLQGCVVSFVVSFILRILV